MNRGSRRNRRYLPAASGHPQTKATVEAVQGAIADKGDADLVRLLAHGLQIVEEAIPAFLKHIYTDPKE
jgi:hypothetical protein